MFEREFIILINFVFSIHSDFFHFIDFVQIFPFFRKREGKGASSVDTSWSCLVPPVSEVPLSFLVKMGDGILPK